jgi:hypothetical protein
MLHFFPHWIDGDNSVVLMLPGGFTAKCHAASRRPVPSLIDGEASDKEGLGVYWEVSHVAFTITGRDIEVDVGVWGFS